MLTNEPSTIRKTPTKEQPTNKHSNPNNSPSKSDRKFIDKPDLIRYESYYNHLILQPFPKYPQYEESDKPL